MIVHTSGSTMDTEDIYDLPHPRKSYKCGPNLYSRGTTLLMKWVMLVKKHPELLSKIEELCQTIPDIINEKNDLGWTSLMMAAVNSRTDSTEMVVQILLQCGADPNLQNNDGWNALMLAAGNSGTDSTKATVALLLQYNPDLNLQQSEGWSVLMIAARYSRTSSTENVVQLLLQNGVDLNLQNNDGCTALMFAVTNSRTDSTDHTVALLLQYGADVNLQTNDGGTALMMAIDKMQEETINLLLQNGADVNLQTNAGWTALTVAIDEMQEEIINLLLQNGAAVGYDILVLGLTNNLSHNLIEKIISMIDNISDTEFRELLKHFKYENSLKKLAPRINFNYDTKQNTLDEVFYYEKLRRIEWRKKYAQVLVDMDITRNRIFYKDTSFGGWITVKKLEMGANMQSLFDILLVSNNAIDQKYMDLFCIHDISRLEELFAYY